MGSAPASARSSSAGRGQKAHEHLASAFVRVPHALSTPPQRLIDGAVILHLVLIPAAADAEQEAAARDLVKRGDGLGKLDRVALDDQADAGSDFELLSDAGPDPPRERRA